MNFFMRILKIFILGLLVSAAAQARESSNTASSIAIQYAETLHPNVQLRSFIGGAAAKTVTINGLIAKYGQAKVVPILKTEIESIASQHDVEWKNNLALSYSGEFSDEELQSLLKDQNTSPYAQKLKDRTNVVGENMQHRSQALLTSWISEVISNTFKAVMAN
jgi:hypothetical protein